MIVSSKYEKLFYKYRCDVKVVLIIISKGIKILVEYEIFYLNL